MKRGADDEIINANELTADDVAMQRVRCPACEAHVFQEVVCRLGRARGVQVHRVVGDDGVGAEG